MQKNIPGTPFKIDPQSIAAGLLELFDQDERDRLRLGLLPADKMRLVENELRGRFSGGRENVESDELLAIAEDGPAWYYSLREVVAFSMREITLSLYAIGDLVV